MVADVPALSVAVQVLVELVIVVVPGTADVQAVVPVAAGAVAVVEAVIKMKFNSSFKIYNLPAGRRIHTVYDYLHCW